jgi:hypothetical protein
LRVRARFGEKRERGSLPNLIGKRVEQENIIILFGSQEIQTRCEGHDTDRESIKGKQSKANENEKEETKIIERKDDGGERTLDERQK